MMLMCVLHAHYVLNSLDHANGGSVAQGIGTDWTNVGLADIVANSAILDFLTKFNDGFAKIRGYRSILTKKIKHKAKSRLTPYSG